MNEGASNSGSSEGGNQKPSRNYASEMAIRRKKISTDNKVVSKKPVVINDGESSSDNEIEVADNTRSTFGDTDGAPRPA